MNTLPICSKIALLGQGDRVLMMVVMIHLEANMATGEGWGREFYRNQAMNSSALNSGKAEPAFAAWLS